MNDNLNLQQYTASGIYTVEIDASQTLTVPSIAGRLLIGSSRRGLINAVVRINDPANARNAYGARDYYLENRGSYFHKYMNVMLNEGPIYALNVVPIDLLEDNYDGNSYVNLDRAAFVPFNAESACFNDSALMYDISVGWTAHKAPIKNYFNRQKFWYASDVELTKVKNAFFANDTIAVNDILSVANLGKKPVTIFMQRASSSGYDVTAREWYSNASGDNVKPSYVHDDDFISDYIVDVIIVEGTWTDYRRLSVDPVYSAYFNERGLITSKINSFLQQPDVMLVTRQVGCLLPDFRDKSDRNIAIDRLINNKYALTELLFAIDYSKLEDYDLSTNTFDPEDVTTYRLDILGHGVPELDDVTESYADDSYTLNGLYPSDYAVLNPMIDVISYRKPVLSTFSFIYHDAITSPVTDDIVLVTESGIDKLQAYEGSKVYKLWEAGHIVNSDRNPVYGSPGSNVFIKILGPFADSYGNYILIEGYEEIELTTITSLSFDTTHHAITFVTYQSTVATASPLENYTMTFSQAVSPYFDIQKTERNKLLLTVANASASDVLKYIKPGNFLQAKIKNNIGRPRMLKIINVATKSSDVPNTVRYEVVTMLPTDANVDGINIGDNSNKRVIVYKGIPNYVSELRGYAISEFVLRESSMPNGTGQRQSDIYKFIFDSGMDSAITSGERLDIRHIVDSYDGEISESSKYYVNKLGAQHSRTLVFYNAPSMKQFESSTDPTFINAYTGLLDMNYIVQGGNFELTPPTFTYKLASDTVNGIPMESFALPCMPNLIIRENGKDKSIPAAAYASNAYIRKLKSGNSFGITAGKRGVITEKEVIGVEYDLTDADRMLLEPAGYNLFVRRKGMGTMLFTNNTAYQKMQSALNNAHVRDSLITIENAIESILMNFLFDYNDGITQIRVKTLVDGYLENVKSARGISWYDTKMDSTNNTEDVLEANAGIIDVYVDFPRGIHKFINRITITRKNGQLSAIQSGFGISI